MPLEAINTVPGDLAQPHRDSGQGRRVHHLDILKKLGDTWIGMNTGAEDRWYPDKDKLVGLFHFHKHITTMDRGWSHQWPTWDTTNGLVEVDFDYALRHDDMPIFRIKSKDPNVFSKRPDMTKVEKALVYRPQFNDVAQVGWAEVFWQLLNYRGLTGITPGWIAKTFGVSMDWYANGQGPPLMRCWIEGKKKGYCK